MKIQGAHPLHKLESVNGSRNDARVQRQTGQKQDSVQLSGEAQWLQDLKEAIDTIPQVRVDEVARARQDIANGKLGSQTDLVSTVNALLHEI